MNPIINWKPVLNTKKEKSVASNTNFTSELLPYYLTLLLLSLVTS